MHLLLNKWYIFTEPQSKYIFRGRPLIQDLFNFQEIPVNRRINFILLLKERRYLMVLTRIVMFISQNIVKIMLLFHTPLFKSILPILPYMG